MPGNGYHRDEPGIVMLEVESVVRWETLLKSKNLVLTGACKASLSLKLQESCTGDKGDAFF